MGLDAMVELVIDRPDREIAFQLLEGLLDLGELHVKAPQAGRVADEEAFNRIATLEFLSQRYRARGA